MQGVGMDAEFDALDENHDGVIDRQEFERGGRRAGPQHSREAPREVDSRRLETLGRADGGAEIDPMAPAEEPGLFLRVTFRGKMAQYSGAVLSDLSQVTLLPHVRVLVQYLQWHCTHGWCSALFCLVLLLCVL